MTKITIHKTGDKIVGFIVDGHTGFANFGEDIVCASLSLLSITAVNSLNIVAGIDEKNINYEINDEVKDEAGKNACTHDMPFNFLRMLEIRKIRGNVHRLARQLP